MTDYYVRPAGGTYGNEDGTSYANAWDGFTNINWATVDTGNGRLFICGTNYETLAVGASGEEGFPIYVASCTIANGASADDPGIIDGEETRGSGIDITGTSLSYVTIDGLTIQNNTTQTIQGYKASGTASNIILKNLTINSPNGEGIYLRLFTDSLVQNCTVDVGSASPSYTTDGIEFGAGTGNTVDGNTVHMHNAVASTDYHNDCVQADGETNFTLKNNLLIHYGINDTSQVVMISNGLGTFTVYNNVVIKSVDAGNVNGCFQMNNDGPWTADIYFWNNTLYNARAGGRNLIMTVPAANIKEIKNNIFINTSGTQNIYSALAPSDKTGINYNCYYESTDVAIIGVTTYDWDAYTLAGYEQDLGGTVGKNVNPSLNANYAPDSVSDPVVNAGTTIVSVTTDRIGISRPQGAAYDIGAYEFVGRGSSMILRPVRSIMNLRRLKPKI